MLRVACVYAFVMIGAPGLSFSPAALVASTRANKQVRMFFFVNFILLVVLVRRFFLF